MSNPYLQISLLREACFIILKICVDPTLSSELCAECQSTFFVHEFARAPRSLLLTEVLCSATTNVLSTVLQLPPGIHHVKFIVDGEMQLSKELPTAVDYTNILVNYIEVSADDLPKTPPAEQKIPEGIFPPQVLPQISDAQDHAPDSVGKTQPVDGNKASEPVFWGDNIPKYLSDLDQPEQSQRYQRAARGVAELATPPSLPLFLGKSILNGTTPMKDDSSVLNMPNHTVLNHLATSSIKNQVLATSVTTRYKRKVICYLQVCQTMLIDIKYVTSIMYKSTIDDGD